MASGASMYDEVEVEDMEYDAEGRRFVYPCPCGDKFFITLDDLLAGEEVATCPSCSLLLRVIASDPEALAAQYGDEESDDAAAQVVECAN